MKKILVFLFFTIFTLFYSQAEEMIFKHGSSNLSGHYFKATNGKKAKAVLLFVHGDGAISYDAEGYYRFIWNALRKNGYAIFSWDKPNVGDSTGNWLTQSMLDRQSEVLAAIDFVQNKYHFNSSNTGLLGFSQAGWVVPALAKQNSKIAFLIGIGFASNWIEQGRYYTKIKHQLAGENKSQISKALASYTKDISFFKQALSYKEYLEFANEEAMTKERYLFVLNNLNSDAKEDYLNISVPSLFLWGEKDLNVNAKEEFDSWKVKNNAFISTKLIANATHGMLKADSFSKQNFGFFEWVKLMWLEEDAFVSEFMPSILTWLNDLKGLDLSPAKN